MKLNITTTKEVEVTLPMFITSTFKTSYYAIMSDTDIIAISGGTITNVSLEVALHGGYNVITHQEFCDKYEEVINTLNNQYDSFMEVIDALTESESYNEVYGNDIHTSNEEEGK